MIFKDVDFGIEAGQQDGIAETAVLRCRFHRCAKAAISIQNFNSLDWYIWDSWFEDCGIGVTNEFGAGNFHVSRSTFLRSKEADLTIRHTSYFSFLGNTSLGSRRFFHAKRAENWKETETWGSQATFRSFVVNAGNGAVGILVANSDQPGGRVYGEQLNVSGFEYGLVSDGLRQTTVELRDAGHNGMRVVGGGPETKSWVALFSGASSRHRHHAPGIHLHDVQNGGRLFVRDIWYEGDAWSLLNLDGSGTFAYHCGFVAPADPNHIDKTLEWEKDVRGSVAALQFSGFKGQLAFTLVSSNGGNVRIVPPSAGTKLYLNGFLTYDGKVDFGGAAMQGEAVVDHPKAFRKDGGGLVSVGGVGKASPEFIREMLAPLRTVKPRPLTDKGRDSSDVRFYRVWAHGRNGVRIQAASSSLP